jgi:N-acetylglutamate synthase-like GNAT family acetyltransferase
VLIRQATFNDAAYIGTHLRKADVVELLLSRPGVAPAATVMQSFRGSTMCRVLDDGGPVLIYGVYPTALPDVAVPWMVATDRISKVRRYFVEHCKHEVDEMMAGCRRLYNRVHRDNRISINWLKWLGFTVADGDGEFLDFWKEVQHV